MFTQRKTEALKHMRAHAFRVELMDQFTTMASELNADGWFAGTGPSLYHEDLHPHNNLVSPTTQAPEPIITGVLDWDCAAFSLSFMSSAPPLWIWAWLDDEDEDERTANDTPPTEEGRELKEVFGQAAGPLYVRYAYPSAYRLARRLMRFAINGVYCTKDMEDSAEMLQERSELRSSGVRLEDS